jgi:hypothetical protein
MRKNIQASNSSFNIKKEAYENRDNVISSFLITQKVINCNNWNVDELEKRENFLINNIMNKLNIF